MSINILLMPHKLVLCWSTAPASKLGDSLNLFSFPQQWNSCYWFCLILKVENCILTSSQWKCDGFLICHLSFQILTFGRMEKYLSLAQFHLGLNLLHIFLHLCELLLLCYSAPAASMKFVLVILDKLQSFLFHFPVCVTLAFIGPVMWEPSLTHTQSHTVGPVRWRNRWSFPNLVICNGDGLAARFCHISAVGPVCFEDGSAYSSRL